MTARDERVEAAWQCIDFADYLQHPEAEKTQVSAALTASDALLRQPVAVERAAEAIAEAEDERHWLWLGASLKDSYRCMAIAAIAALLGEGA